MRILQLTPRLPYPLTDGGAIGIYNIFRGNAARGHDVTLVTYRADLDAETELAMRELEQYGRVRLTTKPLPSRSAALIRSVFRGAYPIERRMMDEMYELLRSLIAAEDFDVVHVDHSHMGRYGLWIKREFGLPIVLRQHNFESMIYERYADREKNPFVKAVVATHGRRLRAEEISFLNEFDRIAAISEEDVEAMKLAAPHANYAVVPVGVPIPAAATDAALAAASGTASGAEKRGMLLVIGGMDWEPNRDAFRYVIEEIFPLVRQKYPAAELHLIGKGTEELLQPANRILGHGRVPDAARFFQQAEVALIPLRIGGGMRVKLVELLAHAKAVVSTSIGAEGNLARDREEILLRDTPLDFADAVVSLLEDENMRHVLGENGRKLMIEEYSIEKSAERFEQEYRLAICARGASRMIAAS